MHKTLLLCLVLSAACLQAAQERPPSDTGPAPPRSSGVTTIEGCLTSANGHYFLTESNGDEHRLSGYANKLGRQVGHKVQITGKPGTKTTSTTSWGAASSAVMQPVFEVKTVTRVAGTCPSP